MVNDMRKKRQIQWRKQTLESLWLKSHPSIFNFSCIRGVCTEGSFSGLILFWFADHNIYIKASYDILYKMQWFHYIFFDLLCCIAVWWKLGNNKIGVVRSFHYKSVIVAGSFWWMLNNVWNEFCRSPAKGNSWPRAACKELLKSKYWNSLERSVGI